MKMSIGYACLTIGVENSQQKSCNLKNATPEKLQEIISNNLNSLESIVDYNIENNIKLFRISSDIIPFGSNPINQLSWWTLYENKLNKIGTKIKNSGMRVSMHPGQYTVLNSPDSKVVENAICDLNYHGKFLDSLGLNREHKLILHIGGIYQEKENAISRFEENYRKLEESVRKRLVIENDDRSYNIRDVLDIGTKLSIPVVFDNLHNKVNPVNEEISEETWICLAAITWKVNDGRQKIHYSQQNPIKKRGSHAETIGIREFVNFYKRVKGENLDIMLEVKDKNLSAVKCILCTGRQKISSIESEWGHYKYAVLEKAPDIYQEIRKLLKNKNEDLALPFYEAIERAMDTENNKGHAINAAQHVWGYFKDVANEKEKNDFVKIQENYKADIKSLENVKSYLWKLTLKYQREYLINSLYFFLT